MGSTLALFQQHLRELWSAVEPFLENAGQSDVDEVRRQLDEHLTATPRAGEAMLLADRLHALIDAREGYGQEQVAVVCAAVRYFLEVDDVWRDLDAGGLSDDTRVVRAAEVAVAGGLHPAQ